jgi:hypothetical protein
MIGGRLRPAQGEGTDGADDNKSDSQLQRQNASDSHLR